MKVKTYRAATMKQALEEVKKELGSEAFILSGKEVKPKKVMGIFNRSYYEVAAAVDYTSKDLEAQAVKKPELPKNSVEMANLQDQVRISGVKSKLAPLPKKEPGIELRPLPVKETAAPTEYSARPIPPAKPRPSVPNPDPKPQASAETANLMKELQDLKGMLRALPVADSTKSICWFKPRQFRNGIHEEVYMDLICRGMDESLAYELLDDAFYEGIYSDLISGEEEIAAQHLEKLSLKKEHGPSFDKTCLTKRIQNNLCSRLKISTDLIARHPHTETQVVALVGPTGVGKTTTLAKLAANAMLEDNLTVGLITLDTFRIAAVEQLRTYAEIIGVPTKVVENPTQMDLAIKSFRDKDLVLIDTAGRSQRKMESQLELAQYFRKQKFIKKVLLLSANTRSLDLQDIIEKYSIFDPGYLIFTKLDETQAYASLLSEMAKPVPPLAYLTIGQNVPRDIIRPDAQKMIDLALGNSPKRWEQFLGELN
jgi:flagellar biosynthesis protein FlhF